jgi:hypothetical protein
MLKKEYAIYLGLGTEFVGLMGACLFLGHLADEKLAWGGFGLIGGVFVALGAWATHFVFVARSIGRAQK